MNIVQGFVTRSDFISNDPSTTSTIFELSPDALTYSLDIGEYQVSDFPESTFFAFKSVTDAGDKIKLTSDQVSEVFQVIQAVIAYVQEHNAPFDNVDFYATISTVFSGKIKSFRMGSTVTSVTTMVPEWLSWESTEFPGFQFKIWTKDEAFREQYDDYTIVTVPPIDNLDSFFSNYGQMVTAINQVTFPILAERIQAARNGHPPTFVHGYTFKYVNPANTNQSTDVPWSVLVYGKNGDNIDTIKDEIVNYVLANSTHSREDWQTIFPDLFKRTEFLFFPRWDKIAIPNLTTLAALFSQMVDPQESIRFLEQALPLTSPSFIDANTTIIPIEYKTLSLICLNGTTNDTGKKDIKTLYPDYIPVQTTSPDFNRMTPNTKDWIFHILSLVKAAETMTQYSTVSNPMRRVIRNGMLYVGVYYNNINFLVAAKSNSIYQ